MSDVRVQTNVVNEQGLHMGPADMLARQARRFQAQIRMSKEGTAEKINAKDVMEITLLAAGQGDQVWVEASGVDAEEAVAALIRLIESGFSENAPHH